MQPQAKIPRKLIDWLAIGWLLVITYLSLAPLPELPEFHTSDKICHIAAYALLAILASIHRRTYLSVFVVAICIVIYGGLIEWFQPLVNRYGELDDFVANCAGVLLGVGTMVSVTWLGDRMRDR